MNPLLSFVPYYLAQDLLSEDAPARIAQERRFPAVALFADVSGFTAISEALGRNGLAGTEELTTLLNSYFEPMISLIQRYGGIIGKFGGDAMTVLFPYDESSHQQVVRQALQCALVMQSEMGRYERLSTSVGEFTLAMKAGLAEGMVFCNNVGEASQRMEYIIAGSLLDRCADAEHEATRGEVVVHQALLAAGAIPVAENRGEFSLVTKLPFEVSDAPLPALPDDYPSPLAEAFLHPRISYRLQTGQAGFINEHRKVTVVFVNFESLDYDADPAVGLALQQYFQAVIAIIQHYDGYLNKIDMGDKGSKYLILFGAPSAHEDDEERALRCALELSALAIPASIGVNTGFVFSGLVGSTLRREYTVIGDVVNLAARLMQAAQPGQILVSQHTQQLAGGEFSWLEQPAISVKGKSDPVAVSALRGTQRKAALPLLEPSYKLPMVGRQAELATILPRLEAAQNGRGQVLALVGEAGIGKSRLGAEIIAQARGLGMTVLGGMCQSHSTTVPYIVWSEIWRGFFGIEADWQPEQQLAHLEAQLHAINPVLVQRMPLLGNLLKLPIPENTLTAGLDGEVRQDLLHSLLLECLRLQSADTPLLMMLDDCHWIDPLSLELLRFLGRNCSDLNVVLLLLYRENEQLADLASWGHFTEFRLTEFSPEEATQLINLKLAQLFGQQQLPSALIERILQRAAGNPFYIDELMNYLHDQGIDLSDRAILTSIELPDSLYRLIISRIDRLSEDEKTLLKVASVIGRLFRASWIWNVYPQLGEPQMVRSYLHHLDEVDITPLDTPEPELEYLFKHASTQEVAYESITYTMRQALHERVGQFIERAYEDAEARFLDALAYHYGRSGNEDKQRYYFRRAGDAAKRSFANEAALVYFERLIPLLPENERSLVWQQLGEVFQIVGRWEEAQNAFQTALALAEQGQDTNSLASARSYLGYFLSHVDALADAVTLLEEAQQAFEQLQDEGGQLKVLEHLSHVRWKQGDYSRSLADAEAQLQLAQSLNDPQQLCKAYRNLAPSYLSLSDLPQAMHYLGEQINLAEQINNRQELLYGLANRGMALSMQQDYTQAFQNYQQALAIAEEIGYRRIAGVVLVNMGEDYYFLGATREAMRCYEVALQIALELGDLLSIAVSVGNAALLHFLHDQPEAAHTWYRYAITLTRRNELPSYLAEYLYHQAQVYQAQGDYAAASSANAEAATLAPQVERHDLEMKSALLGIQLQYASGAIDQRTAVQAVEGLLATWTDATEQAALYAALYQLDATRVDAQQNAAEHYRQLYQDSPRYDYWQQYLALSGQQLPPLPAPPPLPQEVQRAQPDIAPLLEQVAQLAGR